MIEITPDLSLLDLSLSDFALGPKNLVEAGVISLALTGNQALLLEAYTGIDQSQLLQLTAEQQQKVFSGLTKQLELAVLLHGPEARQELELSLAVFLESAQPDIPTVTTEVNSLLIFGGKMEVQDESIANLHGELSHFWRILGWEELAGLSVQSKHTPGSIEDVEQSCGNLIRTLDLLKEHWEENGIGPKLITPAGKAKVKIETTPAYGAIKQKDFPNAIAVLSYRNDEFPPAGSGQDFKERALLLEKLLAKYPAEFAFLIFEYYAFTKELKPKAYNLAILQEYAVDGQRKVKGLLNGRFTILLAQKDADNLYHHSLLTSSSSQTVVGSVKTGIIVSFDEPVSESDLVFITHGKAANAIATFPRILMALSGNSIQLPVLLQRFTKSIGASSEGKPIICFNLGDATEHQVKDISEDMIWQVLGSITSWVRQKGIKEISVEAGHLHADRKPGKLQKAGMLVGAYFVHHLKEMGLDVAVQPMVDEDHVLNTLDYGEYLNLMNSMGYETQELIFESSPIIREIAIAAIMSLLQKYPDNFSSEGNALIFNIPGSDLLVELVRDITVKPFELGCVIFDAALSLYRAYPELGQLYSSEGGKEVHKSMLTVYAESSDPDRRLQNVRTANPYKTIEWDEAINSGQGLPELEAKDVAICNILEKFYLPQQMKLMGILKSLGVNLSLIIVYLTEQGLSFDIME